MEKREERSTNLPYLKWIGRIAFEVGGDVKAYMVKNIPDLFVAKDKCHIIQATEKNERI